MNDYNTQPQATLTETPVGVAPEQKQPDRMTLPGVLRSGAGRAAHALQALEEWASSSKKSLYGFAVLRIIAGITMFGFLAANFSTRLVSYGSGSAWTTEWALPNSAFSTMPVFGFVHQFAYEDVPFTVIYIVLMALSLLLCLGWRFRIVLPFAFVLMVGIFEQTWVLGDMSDNLARIVLLFLFFTDAAAVWSLDAKRRRKWEDRGVKNPLMRLVRSQPVLPAWIPNLLHNAALVLLVFQICLVYFTGGFYKLAGASWREGVAVWYPLQVNVFSTFPEISSWLVDWGPLVGAATLGTVLVQIWFPWMLTRRWSRVVALVVILMFHVAIGIFLGLLWFSLWMVALDALLVSDKSYKRVAARVRRVFPERKPRAAKPSRGWMPSIGNRRRSAKVEQKPELQHGPEREPEFVEV
jgi:hypothetical protein